MGLWKLVDIQAENFLSYKSLDWKVQTGITFIQGINEVNSWEEGNGSGKSSLMEIITWTLFGRLIREGEKKSVLADQVINRIEKENCFTSVTFTNQDKTLTLTRYRKHREFGDKVHGQWGEQPYFPIDNEWIERTLGITYKNFILSNVFGHGSLKRFAESTETEQIKILESLIQLVWIEKARELASKDYTATSDLIVKNEALIASTTATEVEKGKLYQQLLQTYQEKEAKLQQWDILRKEADSTLTQLKYRFTSAQGSLVKKQEALLTVSRELESHKALVRVYDKGNKTPLRVGMPCPTCQQTVLRLPKIAIVAESGHIQNVINQLTQKLLQAQADVDGVNFQLSEIQNQMGRAQQSLETALKEIKTLSGVESLKKQIESLKGDLNALKHTLESLKTYGESLMREVEINAYWKQAFSNQGLKRFAIEKFVPYFESLINETIEYFTDGDYRIELKMENGQLTSPMLWVEGKYPTPYTLFSGGEKGRIDMAIFFAAYKFGQIFSQGSLDLLILDECFNANDRTGIIRAIQRIRQLNHEIILVTGHQDILNSEFNQVVTVRKRNEFSELEVA